jgi:hypothetical protein
MCDVGSFCPNGVPCNHNPSLCPGQCEPRWTTTCTQDCKAPYCGDGFVDLDAGELCDEAEMNGVAGVCASDCTREIEPLFCVDGFSCPDGYETKRNPQAQAFYCMLTETTPAVNVCGQTFGSCLVGNPTSLSDTACGTPDTWSCQ